MTTVLELRWARPSADWCAVVDAYASRPLARGEAAQHRHHPAPGTTCTDLTSGNPSLRPGKAPWAHGIPPTGRDNRAHALTTAGKSKRSADEMKISKDRG